MINQGKNRQTAAFISTYAADVSGVCSALYELGGMTIMHDASGCNSTYNTHDEPRWYDMDSCVFISGITEMDAIMGDDEKLISDIVSAAEQLSPAFVAVAGTPVPMMIGTDFKAIAYEVERRTKIASFGFDTNGMHTYISGASKAFKAIAERFAVASFEKTKDISVNLLGVTPLDFSVNTSLDSTKALLLENGIQINSCWAMGSTLAQLERASSAWVNVVLSYCGLETARLLHKRFAIPYVIGRPFGKLSKSLIDAIKKASATGECVNLCSQADTDDCSITVIGEGVASLSLARAITLETGVGARAISATEFEEKLLSPCDMIGRDESELIPMLENTRVLVADPLYKPVCKGRENSIRFVPLGHEGFSGRIFRSDIPDMVRQISILSDIINL